MPATAMERLAGSRYMSRLPSVLRSQFALNNFIYFGGNFFAGLAGFAFQGLLANALGANGFSEVAPLISLFYLIQIPMFVVMAVAARYTAPLAARGDQSRVNRGYRDLVVYASVVGFAGMVLFILLTPFMRAFLNLPGYGPLVILSAAVPLSLLVGVGRGVVQGEERFLGLSLNFVLYGATTLSFLPLLLAFHLHAVGAMLAINLALVLCNLLAAISLRDLPPSDHHERLPIWPLLRGALAATAGIAAITIFYNFDVLLAKHFLSTQDAGLYSAMSLLGKILFFGTISISVVMFPRVAAIHAEGRRAHRTVNLSLALVTAAGGVVVLAYFLIPHFIVHLLLRKPEYEQIAPYLGLFSLAMLGLALANILVYYFVAVHKRRFIVGIALGAVAFGTLLKIHHGNLGEFTSSVTIAIDLMALALIVTYLLERPHVREEQAHAVAPQTG
jgi:O-antigen/teichoic acid export membrane protein